MRYFKWIYRAIRPHWLAVTCMMLCHVLLAVCSVAFVYVSKKLVDVAVAILAGGDAESSLSVWAVAMGSIILARVFLNALRSYLQTKTEIAVKNRLRYNLFNVILHFKNDGGARHHTGDVLNRMQEDVRQVSSVIASSLPNLIGTVLQFVAAFGFLIYLDVRLALIVVVIVPLGLLLGRFVTSRIRKLTLDIRSSDSRVQAHLQESFQHLALLQTLEHAGASSDTLGGLQDKLYGSEMRRTRFSVLSRIIISLAFSAGHAVAFLWGVWGISTGAVTYGMMTAFLQLVGQIQRPLMEMSSQIPAVIHATASVDRIIELEALPREEEVDPVLLPTPAGVRLSGVSFAYPSGGADGSAGAGGSDGSAGMHRGRKILDGFSYDFVPGSRTAIVGPTGVGKSTMIRLMLALLTPQKGRVEVYSFASGSGTSVSGSVAISHIASPATRCNLVYVPQGNTLFSGSVRENLLMGNPEASDEQLCWALHIAAADFVLDLPLGLDTQCFESGAGLSEGQAQRIAIARALLRPGSILLLDEFSSALDADTESTLLERLTRELPDRTMIFITHRDRIIDFCDSVLRLG